METPEQCVNTKMTSFTSFRGLYVNFNKFLTCSDFSIVDFEQVNAGKLYILVVANIRNSRSQEFYGIAVLKKTLKTGTAKQQ